MKHDKALQQLQEKLISFANNIGSEAIAFQETVNKTLAHAAEKQATQMNLEIKKINERLIFLQGQLATSPDSKQLYIKLDNMMKALNVQRDTLDNIRKDYLKVLLSMPADMQLHLATSQRPAMINVDDAKKQFAALQKQLSQFVKENTELKAHIQKQTEKVTQQKDSSAPKKPGQRS